MAGWLKLNRSILQHWVASEPDALAVWVRFIAEANFEDKKTLFNGSLVKLSRGQLIFGLNAFSQKSGVSISKLRRILSSFEEDGMISRQKLNKYSIITITCYDEYQSFDSQKTVKDQSKDSQTSSETQAGDSQSATPKEVKNSKNKEVNKYTDQDFACAKYILSGVQRLIPDHNITDKNMDKWADTIRLMRERDNLSHIDICRVFKFANNDDFWQSNILSPSSLRKSYNRLLILANRNGIKTDSSAISDDQKGFLDDSDSHGQTYDMEEFNNG